MTYLRYMYTYLKLWVYFCDIIFSDLNFIDCCQAVCKTLTEDFTVCCSWKRSRGNTGFATKRIIQWPQVRRMRGSRLCFHSILSSKKYLRPPCLQTSLQTHLKIIVKSSPKTTSHLDGFLFIDSLPIISEVRLFSSLRQCLHVLKLCYLLGVF